MRGRRAITIASGLLGGLLGYHTPDEGDVFWHLALGRAVLRAGARSVPEPYALGALGETRVVPEWLWGVLTYQTQQLLGFVGLTLLSIALGAVMGALVGHFVDRASHADASEDLPALGWPAQLLLTTLVLTLVGARLRLRPELLANVCLLGFTLIAREFGAERSARSARQAAGLVLLTVLWAQVHGSSVLAPVLFLLDVQPSAFSRERWARLFVVLVLLIAAVFSCAHGLDLIAYIREHAASDAAAHMLDMSPGDWASLKPSGSPVSLSLLLLALTWIGAIVFAPFRLRDAGLVLLGVQLYLTATRFGTTMALLGVPLAAAFLRSVARARRASVGADPARAARVALGLCVAASLAIAGWFVWDFDRSRPLLSAGLSESLFPLRAVDVLRARPGGARVYTPVAAGAVLGFFGDGALQVSIDSRIPLHFDDADFGSYRDASASPQVMELYFRRFGIDTALVKRGTDECRQVQKLMRLISVDARYATFARGSGSALPGIDACSNEHIEPGCSDPAASAQSVAVLTRQRDDAYARWLQAVVALECGRLEPSRAYEALAAPRELPAIRDAAARWRVRALARAGRLDEALLELTAELTDSDRRAASVLSEIWQAGQTHPRITALYQRAVRDMDDATPARERGKLALLCFAQGDDECAYFQGLRAALEGDPVARDVLRQLLPRLARPHARHGLSGWLPLLGEPAMREPARATQ